MFTSIVLTETETMLLAFILCLQVLYTKSLLAFFYLFIFFFNWLCDWYVDVTGM